MKLSFYNQTRRKINLAHFRKIEAFFAETEGTIEITFVSGARIRQANRDFRFKDKVTDVLSFDYSEGREISGEILIYPTCHPKTKDELDRLIIHGILHILGYDHEKDELQAQEMETIQEHFLEKFRRES